MEHIRIALEKARARREDSTSSPLQPTPPVAAPHRRPLTNGVAAPVRPEPSLDHDLPKRVLDGFDLDERRIVSYSRRKPSHVAFDMLRTKVSQVMKEEGWTSLAVTSPTPGCGKTVVSLNLAFSLAQTSEQRVALVDLDLRHPRLASTLGVEPTTATIRYLRGEAELRDIFARVDDNLFLSLNSAPVAKAAEWLQHEKIAGMADRIKETFGVDTVIFDVPPVLVNDDAIVFSPYVDCAIIVAAAGQTKAREIEDCETQMSRTNCLGVVLNKVAPGVSNLYGYGYEYGGES